MGHSVTLLCGLREVHVFVNIMIQLIQTLNVHARATFQATWVAELSFENTYFTFFSKFKKRVFTFLSRVSILLLTRDIDIPILSVRPSVCLSVCDTLVLYENGSTYRHSFFTVRSVSYTHLTLPTIYSV